MNIVIFDLETGGLDRERHPITQLAAAVLDTETGNVGPCYERKIQFDPATCDPEALVLNGYRDREAEWLGAPRLRDVLMEFALWLAPYRDVKQVSRSGREYHVAQLGGHNAAAFDGPWLRAAYLHSGTFFPASFHILDTLQLALMLDIRDDTLGSPLRLEALCERWEVPLVGAHDALADVKATALLAHKLLIQLGQPAARPGSILAVQPVWQRPEVGP